MTDFDVVKLGASKLDPKTRLPKLQATSEVTDGDDAESFGELATFGVPCVTWLPAASSDAGHCEALVARDIGGMDAAVIGARDERSAGVTANMAAGESCLHSTGPGYDSRFFCKNQVAAMVVGSDMSIVVDRNAGTITLHAKGSQLTLGGSVGFQVVLPGGELLELKAGVGRFKAAACFIGDGAPDDFRAPLLAGGTSTCVAMPKDPATP
jgi:hypothetical protein